MNRLVINLPLYLAFGLVATLSASSFAQEKAAPNAASTCNQENGLAILEEQIAATRTFDEQVPRIAVLIRAADFLWPQQRERARAVFGEAFELANRDYKEKGDEPSREGIGMAISVPDQRYIVIRAIAKRDLAWARKLADQVLHADQNEAPEKAVKNAEQETRTAEKLLSLADSLVASDRPAALSFARSSFL